MSTINKVTLLGNVGKDPAVHHLQNGRMRVQLVLATHDPYTTPSGEKLMHTDWHEVILWSPHAEVAAQYLTKGRQVYIEGKLHYRSYLDKEGQRQYTTQIVGHQLVLLGNLKVKNQEKNVEVLHHTPSDKICAHDMGELPL